MTVNYGKHHTRFSDDDVRLMRKLLADGRTLDEVADYFDTSREYVRLIKQNKLRKGIGVDASGVQSVRQAARRKANLQKKAKALFEQGKTAGEIQNTLAISRSAVYNYVGDELSQRRRDRIELARRLYASGLTQDQIASRLDTHHPQVSVWVRGVKRGGAP